MGFGGDHALDVAGDLSCRLDVVGDVGGVAHVELEAEVGPDRIRLHHNPNSQSIDRIERHRRHPIDTVTRIKHLLDSLPRRAIQRILNPELLEIGSRLTSLNIHPVECLGHLQPEPNIIPSSCRQSLPANLRALIPDTEVGVAWEEGRVDQCGCAGDGKQFEAVNIEGYDLLAVDGGVGELGA